MSLEILKKETKSNIIRQIYFFYGVEDYLIKWYCNTIKEKVLTGFEEMNFLIMEDENCDPQKIIDFCDGYPVMSEKKCLIVKNTNLLEGKKSKGSTKGDILVDYLSSLPEYMHIIFVEGETFNKGKLSKFLEKEAFTLDFKYLTNEQLIPWINKTFKDNKKNIGPNEAKYLLENVDADMTGILNECNKLVAYIYDKNSPTIEDIDIVCTKSITSRVFEMIDNIGQKNLRGALEKINDMIDLKEPVIKILVLLARHIRILFQVKAGLKEGLPQNIIGQQIEIKYINKYAAQSNNFTLEKLENALKDCSEADITIKTSGIDDRVVLETLIAKIAE